MSVQQESGQDVPPVAPEQTESVGGVTIQFDPQNHDAAFVNDLLDHLREEFDVERGFQSEHIRTYDVRPDDQDGGRILGRIKRGVPL